MLSEHIKNQLKQEFDKTINHQLYLYRNRKFKALSNHPSNGLCDGKLFTEKQYYMLKGLYEYVLKNRNLLDYQIEGIIKAEPDKYKFFNKMLELVPEVIDNIRIYGPLYIALIYKQRRLIEKFEKTNSDKIIKNL